MALTLNSIDHDLSEFGVGLRYQGKPVSIEYTFVFESPDAQANLGKWKFSERRGAFETAWLEHGAGEVRAQIRGLYRDLAVEEFSAWCARPNWRDYGETIFVELSWRVATMICWWLGELQLDMKGFDFGPPAFNRHFEFRAAMEPEIVHFADKCKGVVLRDAERVAQNAMSHPEEHPSLDDRDEVIAETKGLEGWLTGVPARSAIEQLLWSRSVKQLAVLLEVSERTVARARKGEVSETTLVKLHQLAAELVLPGRSLAVS